MGRRFSLWISAALDRLEGARRKHESGLLHGFVGAWKTRAKLIAARVNCRAGTYNVERLAERQQSAPARAVEQLPTPVRDSILTR